MEIQQSKTELVSQTLVRFDRSEHCGRGWTLSLMQIQLINIASEQVPDKYVDLVIGYLATTVGAARQVGSSFSMNWLSAPLFF